MFGCPASYSEARVHLRDAENGVLSSAAENDRKNIEQGRRKQRCVGQRECFIPSPHKRQSMLRPQHVGQHDSTQTCP